MEAAASLETLQYGVAQHNTTILTTLPTSEPLR